jgi:hypothetical protein
VERIFFFFAEDTDQWQDLVQAANKPWVPFSITKHLSASQQETWSVALVKPSVLALRSFVSRNFAHTNFCNKLHTAAWSGFRRRTCSSEQNRKLVKENASKGRNVAQSANEIRERMPVSPSYGLLWCVTHEGFCSFDFLLYFCTIFNNLPVACIFSFGQ